MNLHKNTIIPMILAWILLATPIHAAVGGFTHADIISNHESLSGQVWIIQWTETGYDSDSLIATMSPNDFYDLTSNEFTTDQDFEIKVDATNDGCFYRIQQASKPKVFTVDAVYRTFWSTDRANRDAWIMSNCFNGQALVHEAIIDDVWCYVVNDYIGTPGEIGSPQYEFETTWSIQAEGKPTQTATVCSGASTSDKCSRIDAQIGNYAYVEWQGSLETGKKCEDAKNEYAMHSNSFSSGWRVTDKAAYDDFYSYWYSLQTWKTDIENWAAGHTTESSIESKANNLAWNSVASKTSGIFVSQWSDLSPDIEDPSIDNGIIRWSSPDDRLMFPTFNLYVDGNYYLKVKKPCGTPQIQSVSINTIDEGTRENAQIRVKNIGDYMGGFNIRVEDCTNGFSVQGGDVGITLNPDETRTVQIPIGFTSTSSNLYEYGTCKAVVSAVCPDTQTDTYTFNVQGKQMQECTPGHKKCGTNGEEIIVCNNDGLEYVHLEFCGEGEVCINGECVAESPLLCGDGICEPGETQETCPIDCKPAICGDGICQATESALTCPADCQAAECMNDLDCNDNLVCTVDTCVSGKCVNTPIPGCEEPGGDFTFGIAFYIGLIVLGISIIGFVAYIIWQRTKRMQPRIPMGGY